MIDNKAKLYVLVYSNGMREEIHGTIAYAIKIADHIIADMPAVKYVDVYLRDVHRVRVYDITAHDAGSPPIMYLSDINQPLRPAA